MPFTSSGQYGEEMRILLETFYDGACTWPCSCESGGAADELQNEIPPIHNRASQKASICHSPQLAAIAAPLFFY